MTTTTSKTVSPKAQVHAPASIADVIRRDKFGNVAPQALWRHKATGVVCARFAGKVFPASFTGGVIAIDHNAAPVGSWVRDEYAAVKNVEFMSKAERSKHAKAETSKVESKADRQQQRIADAVARILARAGASAEPAETAPAQADASDLDMDALVKAAMVKLSGKGKPASSAKRGRAAQR